MCIISVYISIGNCMYSMLHNIIYSTYLAQATILKVVKPSTAVDIRYVRLYIY